MSGVQTDSRETLVQIVEAAIVTNHPTAIIRTTNTGACDFRIISSEDHIGVRTSAPYTITDEDIADVQESVASADTPHTIQFYLREDTGAQETAFFKIHDDN